MEFTAQSQAGAHITITMPLPALIQQSTQIQTLIFQFTGWRIASATLIVNERGSCLHIRYKPSFTEKPTENIKLNRDAKIKLLILYI